MKSFVQIRGQKLKKILFLDITITSSCLSWSLCTPEHLSKPFLMWRNGAKSFWKKHKFLFFSKNWKSMKMFRKNLCDKVSRMKNLRLLSSFFFCARRRGVLSFFGRRIFHGENRETKSPILSFFQKNENLWKCFAKISVTKFRK